VNDRKFADHEDVAMTISWIGRSNATESIKLKRSSPVRVRLRLASSRAAACNQRDRLGMGSGRLNWTGS
jgi:hypothetical protein